MQTPSEIAHSTIDTRDILRQRLNEYREYRHQTRKMIGKFPIDIFRRWYDQYNQMYNRESEKLTEIFNKIFSTLKQRHEEAVKEQIKVILTTNRNSHTARYLLGLKEFNSDNYLTCDQVKQYSDLIGEQFQMSELELSLFREFLDRYYSETKISIIEFNTHLMMKYKGYLQTKTASQ